MSWLSTPSLRLCVLVVYNTQHYDVDFVPNAKESIWGPTTNCHWKFDCLFAFTTVTWPTSSKVSGQTFLLIMYSFIPSHRYDVSWWYLCNWGRNIIQSSKYRVKSLGDCSCSSPKNRYCSGVRSRYTPLRPTVVEAELTGETEGGPSLTNELT